MAVGSALALLAGVGAVAAGPADDRFDAIDGPLGPSIVRPDAFGIDATKVLADVPALMDRVDGDRARDLVERLSFPRAATSPDADRQAATDLVVDEFRDAGYEPQLQSVVLPETGKDEPNVFAELPGTQCPGKVLVIGAHYDSVRPDVPGADDNATGVAGLFEIARALRDQPLPVTVRLVGWSYEEEGLVGSRVMAAADKAAGTDVVGAVAFDMIGFTEEDIDPLTGLPGNYLAMIADPTSAPLARTFGAAAYTYIPEFPAAGAIIDPAILSDILRSDHASYLANGYPGLLISDTGDFRNENYHLPSDDVDTIDWEFMRNATRASLAGLATYGSSDQDSDGTADLCGAATPPSTTSTLPPSAPSSTPSTTPMTPPSTTPTTGPEPTTPGPSTPGPVPTSNVTPAGQTATAAVPATAVAGDPRYTG